MFANSFKSTEKKKMKHELKSKMWKKKNRNKIKFFYYLDLPNISCFLNVERDFFLIFNFYFRDSYQYQVQIYQEKIKKNT